jgi:hypothetical protein
MKRVIGESVNKKIKTDQKNVLSGENTNLKNEINTAFSFSEFNPNPVIEMDLDFDILYINPSAKTIHPGIQKQGINHPFLKNIKQIFLDLKNNNEEVPVDINLSSYCRSLIGVISNPFITTGIDGKITEADTAMERITGLACRELIGTGFSEYFSESEKAREDYRLAFEEEI